jgi:outer membrane autotransporter protein
VTTAAGTTVTGGDYGIFARNYGGALNIEANGDVTGGGFASIYARNEGTDLTITTGPSPNGVTGVNFGISARNYGNGATTVTANCDVEGTDETGIFAQNFAAAGNLSVTTSAGTTVKGNYFGIDALNYGRGALHVIANGDVTATGAGVVSTGIFAQNGTDSTSAGTNLTVTTRPSANGVSGDTGIDARNYGSGFLRVIANGDVTGSNYEGIFARNEGTSLAVTTGAGSNVTGSFHGVAAYNYGSGALTVTANGEVTGNGRYGIFARNGTYGNPAGTSLTVTTGADSTITGLERGIAARNYGSGALDVTVKGDVTGSNNGVFALNNATSTGDLTITTAAGRNVTAIGPGVRAGNFAGTAINIAANGDVTGGISDGISAEQGAGGPINIAVGAAGHVTSNGPDADDFAIDALGGPASLTVAGPLNGGGGGAVSFDQMAALDDRLELRPTATIDGLVLAGPGEDTLAFGGSGDGAFDLGAIGNGAQQYRDFETFAVESGTWSFAGATTAPFTVNGGTMMGTGTFGGLAVNDGGILAPGNSIGTITVNGAFALNAGAVFEVEANAAGQSDKVIVNGTVSLTGSVLRVLASSGNYKPRTEYVIVENDGSDAVEGKFADITVNLAFLSPSVVYDGGTGNDVVLTLQRTSANFCAVAATRNQCNVANALDLFHTDNKLFLAVLNQTAEGARQAFDALSGEIHATPGVLADDSRYVREAILGRLMQASYTSGNGQVASLGAGGPPYAALDSQAMAVGYDDKALGANMPPSYAPGLTFWTRAYGAWADFDGNGNAASADRDLGGFVSGMDAQISGSWRAGLAAGGSISDVSVADRHSSADVESFHLAGYTGGMAGPLALRAGGAWSWNDIDASRAILFPGFFERADSSYDADTGQLFGEVAYPTTMGRIAIEPFAGLAYVSIDSDSFRERGNLAALSGSADSEDVGYSTLGLRAATVMHWNGMAVTPHVSAAWQHAFDDVTPVAALAFASTGIGFDITGVPLAEDSALIEAGLDLALGPRVTAGASYSGQFGDGVADNAVKGRFTWLF